MPRLLRLLFLDTLPLFRGAKRRSLEFKDFPEASPPFGEFPFPAGSLATANEKTPALKLILVILKEQKFLLFQTVILFQMHSVLVAFLPYAIHAFLESLETSQNSLVWALAIAAISFTNAIIFGQYMMGFLRAKLLSTLSLQKEVLRKAYHLEWQGRKENPAGELINRLEVDVDSVTNMVERIADALAVVTHIVLATFLLHKFLGWAGAVSISVLLLAMPVAKWLAQQSRKIEKEVLARKDQRVTFLSQVITGIRLIKSYVWERSVVSETIQLREEESKELIQRAKLNSLSSLIFSITSSLAAVLGFGLYVWSGNDLKPAVVFAALVVYYDLPFPFMILKDVINVFAKTLASAERLARYFSHAELPPQIYSRDASLSVEGLSVELENRKILEDINFHLAAGEKLAIVGPVGAGKSVLLEAILGELPHGGKVSLAAPEQRTYVSQQAFILNNSIQANVAFGRSLASPQVEKALRLAQLWEDVERMPKGMLSEIGEHGINLSGGQKQRLSLARAVASEAKTLLLDDPFSAVDETTENRLIEELFQNHWRAATILCVTHRLQHLRFFDKILFLKDGQVVVLGPYSEAIQNREFREFVESEKKVKHQSGDDILMDLAKMEEKKVDFTVKEDRRVGRVDRSVYLTYFQALGGGEHWKLRVGFLVAVLAFGNCVALVESLWLKVWSQSGNFLGFSLASPGTGWLGFSLLALVSSLLIFLGSRLCLIMVIRSASHIHNQALQAIVKTPLRYFDSNPSGRILNRFSVDVEKIESGLSRHISGFLFSIVNLVFKVGFICLTLPMAIPVALFILVFYGKFFSFTQPASREGARLQGMSRSPVFSFFRECVRGRATIRAQGAYQAFAHSFAEKVELAQKLQWNNQRIKRFTDLGLGFFATTFVFFVAVICIYLVGSNQLSIATTGLLLVFSNEFMGSLKGISRGSSEIENSMVSVERLKDVARLAPEPTNTLEPYLSAEVLWPQKANIKFHSVSARYDIDLPIVLREVSFTIPAGHHVAIVGRTGSGKSSVTQALCRNIEIASGEICIDGVNIRAIPLDRLRKNIAFVPQDPVLLLGTIRRNLDREKLYSDEEVWRAIEKANLRSFVESLPNKLNTSVEEGGGNFSMGQRQLLCLARAILAQAPIVILDEATASVDIETDTKVQNTIQNAFQGVTTIIIAHRPSSTFHCDQVIELAEGQVKQIVQRKKAIFSSPHQLGLSSS
jgi:ABC-type multidrug transport system fused ATPase/permease subunit